MARVFGKMSFRYTYRMTPTMDAAALKDRIEAARGKRPSDLVFRGARYLDVFSGRWMEGDVAVHGGVVVGLDPGYRATREIDARGKWLVPGFIDAHVHVESSCLVPTHFQDAVLPKGTTTAICDPHELANVQGVQGLRYFLESSENLSLDLWVMLSSCVPATHLETNGGGTLTASDLVPLASHPRALGLAEMMNVPGVLESDPAILEKILAFAGARAGAGARPIDGHCPLLRGQGLSAYAAAGITSCHESSQLEEAREKLRKGIAVWIREGSVAKDLDALIPLLDEKSAPAMGFCTDDRNPLDILTEGHVDHLVRRAIASGVAPEVVYRAASWSVAMHYGIDRGPARVGAIAPGWKADLVLLDDARTCQVSRVLKAGFFADEIGSAGSSASVRQTPVNSVRCWKPEPRDLEGPSGRVHVIGVEHGKIITTRSVESQDAPGVARLTVLERHGRGHKPANAYVRGFGENLRGAIASSVGHDSHNLIVVGSDTRDMAAALGALIECGGGFAVVQGGKCLARLELPFGGLMSERDPAELKTSLEKLKGASRAAGCPLPEPFLQLAFLSLPVIPSLKLTDLGLVDVDRFERIAVGL
jgi:adenine deaminase